LKRGLITWDISEIQPAAFEQRLQNIRRVMSENQVPCIVVYSDVWRSNSARFLSNYMPYFNRALLIIPSDQHVTLLCGLSPRAYGWIRSVSPIEDVRPAGNYAQTLMQMATERRWTRIGILDFPQFPYDLNQSIQSLPIEIVKVGGLPPFSDDTELSMRRKAASMARSLLAAEIPLGVGCSGEELIGRLERRSRRAGAGDLITLVTNGRSTPGAATGHRLDENFSVSIALEYRGHWVRVSRAHGVDFSSQLLLENQANSIVENLSGSYPYECVQRSELREDSIFAVHIERQIGAKRLFYGDSFLLGPSGPELL